MTYKIFLPHESLVRTARRTVQALAFLGSALAILIAGTMVLYALSWTLSMLTNVIHGLVSVCQALFAATGSSPASTIGFFIFLLLLNIKLMYVLFPSFPSFFKMQGVRV